MSQGHSAPPRILFRAAPAEGPPGPLCKVPRGDERGKEEVSPWVSALGYAPGCLIMISLVPTLASEAGYSRYVIADFEVQKC